MTFATSTNSANHPIEPALTAALGAIVQPLRQSTVQVRVRQTSRAGQRGRFPGSAGVGSGIIWSSDGVIITNDHVVRSATAEVELSDGRILPAIVINRSRQRDLVALQVQATDLLSVTVGDSDAVRVGELVVAVGNPLGQVGAMTLGIIHTVGLPPVGTYAFRTANDRSHSWLQTDLPLAPGNSGGPLANAQGQVIGVNTMIVNGRGFAIPSRVVQQFLQRSSQQPYLGVTVQPVQVRYGQRGVGLLITHIEANSPAEAAHLHLGDVLIGVRDRPFQQLNELFLILENSNSGDGLPLSVLRGDRRIQVDVVLCSRDSAAQAA